MKSRYFFPNVIVIILSGKKYLLFIAEITLRYFASEAAAAASGKSSESEKGGSHFKGISRSGYRRLSF